MAIEITLAYIADLIFGDPRWLPHPVKGIGWMIKKLEQPLRVMIRDERTAGIVLAIVVIGVSWCFSFVVISIASFVNRYLGYAFSILFIYSSIAIKDLGAESMEVYRPLEKKDITLARKKLSLIVGRDTCNLEPREIVRAAVETISENMVDGIISPLFYAFIGGAPLAIAYKAVNTLDSMVGYKNERYKYFGWASARIDDWANFIPARLSLLFVPLACLLAGKDAPSSLRIAGRDGRKNPSPNSGIPEAAIAGALGVQLGGLNFYNSIPGLKPLIGDEINALEPRHIKEAIKISYICSALFLIIGVFLIIFMGRRWI